MKSQRLSLDTIDSQLELSLESLDEAKSRKDQVLTAKKILSNALKKAQYYNNLSDNLVDSIIQVDAKSYQVEFIFNQDYGIFDQIIVSNENDSTYLNIYFDYEKSILEAEGNCNILKFVKEIKKQIPNSKFIFNNNYCSFLDIMCSVDATIDDLITQIIDLTEKIKVELKIVQVDINQLKSKIPKLQKMLQNITSKNLNNAKKANSKRNSKKSNLYKNNKKIKKSNSLKFSSIDYSNLWTTISSTILMIVWVFALIFRLFGFIFNGVKSKIGK
jgi:hypothetical protein